MQLEEYEKAVLVATSWQVAKSADINELLAVACTIRNWVIPKHTFPGYPIRVPMREKLYYQSYSEACEEFLSIYFIRGLPRANEPAIVDPDEGLLAKIDSIYDCTLPDMTSSSANPLGARYFNRGTDPTLWVYTNIVQDQSRHPLIGTFGSMQFYA